MDARERRIDWAGAALATLAVHLLFLLIVWEQLRPAVTGERGVRVLGPEAPAVVLLPRARPPVPRQAKDVPEPQENARLPLLPPPLTAETGRSGKGDVFCFERPPVNGIVVYDCLRLWPPEDPVFDTRVGFADPWPDIKVHAGPLLGPRTVSLEEAIGRGWTPGRRKPAGVSADPAGSAGHQSGAERGRDPSPIPD